MFDSARWSTENFGMRKRVAAILMLGLLGCGNPSFTELPESVKHDVEEGGHMHAPRLDDPFMCGDDLDDLEKAVPCTDVRPLSDELVSCDTAGCHGNYDFNPTSTAATARHLWGSEGPSCYTCHGEEWD